MKQAEKERVYLISEAAKKVGVETHVLRYWEEELDFNVKRNEMGHRYYTIEDVERLQEVKRLKEQGLQLKAIKNGMIGNKELNSQMIMVNRGEFTPVSEESREAKSYRLQQLLQNMIMEAVRSNNKEVAEDIKNTILKEMDYQFRNLNEREDERDTKMIDRQEEYYTRLDELLRVKSTAKKPLKELFGKKKKTSNS